MNVIRTDQTCRPVHGTWPLDLVFLAFFSHLTSGFFCHSSRDVRVVHRPRYSPAHRFLQWRSWDFFSRGSKIRGLGDAGPKSWRLHDNYVCNFNHQISSLCELRTDHTKSYSADIQLVSRRHFRSSFYRTHAHVPLSASGASLSQDRACGTVYRLL